MFKIGESRTKTKYIKQIEIFDFEQFRYIQRGELTYSVFCRLGQHLYFDIMQNNMNLINFYLDISYLGSLVADPRELVEEVMK
jgi:hypothetical protein